MVASVEASGEGPSRRSAPPTAATVRAQADWLESTWWFYGRGVFAGHGDRRARPHGRRRRGMSVETAAGLAGVDKSFLSRLERGGPPGLGAPPALNHEAGSSAHRRPGRAALGCHRRSVPGPGGRSGRPRPAHRGAARAFSVGVTGTPRDGGSTSRVVLSPRRSSRPAPNRTACASTTLRCFAGRW